MASSAEAIHRDAVQQWQAGQRGDFRGFRNHLAHLSQHPTPVARAWEIALRALRWHAEPSHGELSSPASITALAEADPACRAAAARACAQMERACVLALDADGLARWTDVHERLLDGGTRDPEAALTLRAADCWKGLLAGNLDGLERHIDALAGEASEARLAPLVIEATVLRAVAAMSAGDLQASVRSARRASRMARTEELPQSQYLAHLVLARLRRLTHRPHLAVRILTSLARVAPAPWAGWLEWERRFAGDDRAPEPWCNPLEEDPRTGVVDHAGAGARALVRLLDAAARGTREDFEDAARTADAHCRGCPWRRSDLAAAVTGLDPHAEATNATDPALAGWLEGSTHEPPAALAGLCTVPDAATAGETAAAYVLARPPEPARRVLSGGLGLADGGARRIRQMRRRKGRTDTGLAALALAGPRGLTREALFRAVYGFNYVPALHQGVLDVLLHRLRSRLESSATMRREEDRVWLEITEALLLPDPRCTSSMDGRVLRLFATQSVGTANEAARTLGIPIRTAQQAVRQLVDEGILLVERQGKQVTYRIEDTTFSEPTRN